VRNAYESDIGRFDGQKTANGATLLDPQVRKGVMMVRVLTQRLTVDAKLCWCFLCA
jgi:hypothetical protein